MRRVIARLPAWVIGVAEGVLFAVYLAPFLLRAHDRTFTGFEIVVCALIAVGKASTRVTDYRRHMTPPGGPPLTADEQIQAFRVCRAAQPPEDARIRVAATQLAEFRIRRGGFTTRNRVIVLGFVVVLALLCFLAYGPVGLLYVLFYGGSVWYRLVLKQRRRREARAYLAAVEQVPVA